MKKLPNLTSLRFLLAILVVIYHIPQFFANRNLPYYDDLPIFSKGGEAVFMFFSLSGFLIIKQLFDEKKHIGRINLKAFYMRRILRIFPLYYFVLVIGFLYYQILLHKIGFEFESNYPLWKGVLLSVTFFPNIFATYSPGGILEILWSIGIEEQFYILIAPVLLLLPLSKIKTFLLVFTIVYFTVYFSPLFTFLQEYKMLFFYFSFAGFCSLLLEKHVFRDFVFKIRIPILVLFILYFTTNLYVDNFNNLFYHLFGMILFGMSLSVLSTIKTIFLENKILEYLGKISYGIYMYHAIVMQFVGFIFIKFYYFIKLPSFLFISLSYLLTIGITILVSGISYQYFEKYFLERKKYYRIKR